MQDLRSANPYQRISLGTKSCIKSEIFFERKLNCERVCGQNDVWFLFVVTCGCSCVDSLKTSSKTSRIVLGNQPRWHVKGWPVRSRRGSERNTPGDGGVAWLLAGACRREIRRRARASASSTWQRLTSSGEDMRGHAAALVRRSWTTSLRCRRGQDSGHVS